MIINHIFDPPALLKRRDWLHSKRPPAVFLGPKLALQGRHKTAQPAACPGSILIGKLE
jgi:hypothetical protein